MASEIRVNSLTNRSGLSTVTIADTGVVVAGMVTATDAIFTGDITATNGSFSGNVSVGGTLTYEDVTNIDSIGIITARAGVDVNNGHIVLDSGYSLQWSDSHERIEQSDGKIEFFTNNTEKVTLSGSNFGIGTNNPTTEFEVLGAGTVASFRGTGGSSFIGIKDEDDGSVGFIGVDGGSLKFQTSGGSYSDKLTITSSGVKQVKNGNLNIYQTYIDFSGDQSSTPQTAVALYRPADGTFAISTQNTERLRIRSDGRVTIGTQTINTNSMLSIHRSSSDESQIRFTNTTTGEGGNNGLLVGIDSNEHGRIFNQENSPLRFGTDNTERLRIRAEGPHLLIGTDGDATYNEITESSSNAGLVIGSSSMGNGGIVIRNSTSGTGRIYFADNSGSDPGRQRGQINYYHNSDYMMFATAGSERLRITSAGNITLGYGGASLYFQNGFNNSASRIQNGGGSNNSNFKFYTISSGTEAERLRIQSDGNVIPMTTGAYNLGISGNKWNKVWTNYVRYGTRSATYERTLTATSNGSGDLTFECGVLWLIDDSSFEVLVHIDRTGSHNSIAARYKFYGSKVSGFGTQGTYRSDTSNFYIISPMSNPVIDSYTPSGHGVSHGTRIRHTSAAANAEYRITMLINWVGQREVT